MRIKYALKLSMIAASVLLSAACTRFGDHSQLHYGMDNDMSTQGLGQFTRFSGQNPGESYTTKAPHNQRYLFTYDSSTLAPRYLDSLNAQANYLKTHPQAKVLLAGHTDERGSREYNVALGERRAYTVADILKMHGVNRTQIRVISYGKEQPANFGHDAASHRQNRRVELTYEAHQ
ncbi:MAG: peptidoglycan-associated lipoprotein [Legionellaceae bacterium]|nr:peptidoglycan-associated lipoprotein [Legionellaceae bacterium]HCA90285.1 peptidoglycan-associated lipoprotein Pal [Legionellales bacterium]|tara:strand:- start:22 stop:549 length:528 start_codon:yes stop_codon:yes gene_type:complete